MKNLLLGIILFTALKGVGQGTQVSFVDFQRSLARPAVAMQNKLDTLQKQFAAKGLQWPAKYMYVRSFKYDAQMEVWVSNSRKEPFKLFKSYRVCALAGSLGPKRCKGITRFRRVFITSTSLTQTAIIIYHLALIIQMRRIEF